MLKAFNKPNYKQDKVIFGLTSAVELFWCPRPPPLPLSTLKERGARNDPDIFSESLTAQIFKQITQHTYNSGFELILDSKV